MDLLPVTSTLQMVMPASWNDISKIINIPIKTKIWYNLYFPCRKTRARASHYRQVSQMGAPLAACHEPAGNYNRLTYVLYNIPILLYNRHLVVIMYELIYIVQAAYCLGKNHCEMGLIRSNWCLHQILYLLWFSDIIWDPWTWSTLVQGPFSPKIFSS